MAESDFRNICTIKSWDRNSVTHTDSSHEKVETDEEREREDQEKKRVHGGGEAWRKSKEKVKVKLKKSWMQPFQLIPKPAAISVHRAPLQIKCRKWNGETFWLQSFHITSDINYFPSSDSLSYRRQWAPVLQNRAWTLLDTVYDSQQVSKPASHSPYWYTVFTVLHILYTLFGNEMN